MHYLVRLFPEIIVKSAPVRKRFIRRLRDNLRALLKPVIPDLQITSDWDRIELRTGCDGTPSVSEIERVLESTPGVGSYSRIRRQPFTGFEDAAQSLWPMYGEAIVGRSFAVRIKRRGQHDFSSADAEREIGGRLLARAEGAWVRLKNPEVGIHLRLEDQTLVIIEATRPGLGGFPLGTQDGVLSLISGGFDSTVASFQTIKRGLQTHYCFFNLGGRAHELGVKEVAHYLWNRYGASHRVKFISVPFEPVVAEILSTVDNAQMGVVLKRMMLRAATAIARERGIEALVTGESVAQVSSQTLANLAVIDSVTDMLTIRPLATLDKNEIIDTARRIGTEAFAANIPEYCGVISVKPTTRARPERIAAEEAKFDFSVLEAAVAGRREENIDQMLDNWQAPPELEVFSSPQPDAAILDIRHPDEVESKPLQVGAATALELPFYALQSRFKDLDQSTRYLLYCDKGVMSGLHAELLREQGFENIGVYRP